MDELDELPVDVMWRQERRLWYSSDYWKERLKKDFPEIKVRDNYREIYLREYMKKIWPNVKPRLNWSQEFLEKSRGLYLMGEFKNITYHGQLLTTKINDMSINRDTIGFISNDANLYAYSGFMLGERNIFTNIEKLFLAKDVIEVACGRDHILFTDVRYDLYGCGKNTAGELGLGHRQPRYTITHLNTDINKIAAADLSSLVLSRDGQLFFMGANLWYKSGISLYPHITKPTFVDSDVISMSLNVFHLAYITNTDELWVCGRNNYGQLGLGHTDNIKEPTLAAYNVSRVSCGLYHTVCLSTDNILYVCGSNSHGQLALDLSLPFEPNLTELYQNIFDFSCGDHTTAMINSDLDLYIVGQSYTLPESSPIPLKIQSYVHSVKCSATNCLFLGYIL